MQNRRVEHRGFAPLVRGYARIHVRTYAHTLQQFVFFAVTSVTLSLQKHRKNHISSRLTSNFSSSWKLTYSFSQNNVSFSSKQRVVFLKTTCRFITKFASFAPCSFGEQNTLVALTKIAPEFCPKKIFWGLSID